MMAFIYCLTTLLGLYLLKDKINKLEERVKLLECLFGEVEKNEVDD